MDQPSPQNPQSQWSSLPDEELRKWFGLIAQGDEQAFTTVFLQYSAYIFPFASGQLQSEEEARDLVQEVFLQLWLYRDNLSAVDNPRGYLHRMIYHGLLQRFKKMKKRYAFMKAFGEEQLLITTRPDGLYADLADRFHQAIAALPADRKKIFLLRSQGLKVNEIARELGISVNTVKTQLKRSFASVREFLKEEGLPLVLVMLLARELSFF